MTAGKRKSSHSGSGRVGGEVNALKDNERREGGRGGEEVAGTEGKVMKERFGCKRAHAPGPAGGIIAACV